MAISQLNLYANTENPNDLRIMVLDYQGRPTQYTVTKDQFNQLRNIGFPVQRATDIGDQNLKGQLPSLDILKKMATDTSDIDPSVRTFSEFSPQIANTQFQAKARADSQKGGRGIVTLSPEEYVQLLKQKSGDTSFGSGVQPFLDTLNKLSRADFVNVSTQAGELKAIPPSEFQKQFKAARAAGQSAQDFLQNFQADEQGNVTKRVQSEAPQLTGSTPQAAIASAKEQAGQVSLAVEPQKIDTTSIPFKSGLSETQKTGITNLANKPQDQWTETDKKNWAYATNNAPLPSAAATLSQASTAQTTLTGGIPDEILQSPEYQALTTEQQELAQFAYNIQKEEDVLRKIRAEAALAEAIKLADPVFKSQLRILQDELQRGISSQIASNTESRQQLVQQIDFLRTQGNLQEAESLAITLDQAQRENSSREAQVGAEIARIQRGIANIQEDLTFNRGQIGIEEQAQLARQVRQYEQQLTQTQEAAVDAGLGFSSIRAEAEKRLGEELGDISESTRRQAMRDIRNLEVTSSRKQQEAEFSQTDLERRSAEQQLELARRTEQVVGSEKLPSGLLPTGQNTLGIRGSITEGVQAREQQLQNLQLEQQSQERVGQEKLTDIVRAGEQTLGTANLPTEATTSIAPLGSITGTFETDRLNEISRLQGILEERQGETISLSNNND